MNMRKSRKSEKVRVENGNTKTKQQKRQQDIWGKNTGQPQKRINQNRYKSIHDNFRFWGSHGGVTYSIYDKRHNRIKRAILYYNNARYYTIITRNNK